MANKEFNVIIKGTDQLSPQLDKIERRVGGFGATIRTLGGVADFKPIKKFGKDLNEIEELTSVRDIRANATEQRALAMQKYAQSSREVVKLEDEGLKKESARTAAVLFRREINKKLAEDLQKINEQEKASLRSRGMGNIGVRAATGVFAAGAVIGVAGAFAESWDKANQKIEAGEIKASEFTAELLKGLPIIGGITSKAESLLMVITGTAKALRDANKEAAELDKKINGQNADRKAIDALTGGLTGLNDTDKQRIVRESNAKLKEIEDARKAGEASGVVNAGNERDVALKNAAAAVIRKRESDLAAIEQRERETRAKQIESVDDRIEAGRIEIEDQRLQTRIATLREQGKEEEAAILAIQSEAIEKKKALDRERNKLIGEGGLTDAQRIALNDSIDARKQGVDAEAGARIRGTINDARREASEKLAGANEKARLEASEQLEREKEKARREDEDRQSRSVATQLGDRTRIFDARGQTSFFNQSKMVTPLEDAAKKTADNTKAAIDKLEKMISKFDRLIEAVGQSSNAGFIS